MPGLILLVAYHLLDYFFTPYTLLAPRRSYIMLLIAITTVLFAFTDRNEGAQFPAMFVFGDSLIDPGNNNHLLTLAKANFYPNGIDFSAGPTGRFCNGGTMLDHFGDLLGLPLIPPFNSPSTDGLNILKGVNYASAGAGILWDTGLIYGDVITMDEQMQNFKEKTLAELKLLLGNGTREFLGRSLFFIGVGSNDYINNYLHPLSMRADQNYTSLAFVHLLIQEYTRLIKEIHGLGARKFFITGVAAMGCIPNQIAAFNSSKGECIESINRLAVEFNSHAQEMVRELDATLRGASFIFWDIFPFAYSIISNHSLYGFRYANKACCGGGRAKGQIICLPMLQLECRNRSEYIFWDPYHPTDAFNAIASNDAYQLLLRSWDI